MSCDLKPGDEVVVVGAYEWLEDAPRWMFWTRTRTCSGPKKGEVCVVTEVAAGTCDAFPETEIWLRLEGWGQKWFDADHFRKVQRRDLSAWLKAEKTIEEPKRAPAKKRERVQ